jgi:hypothetical protein
MRSAATVALTTVITMAELLSKLSSARLAPLSLRWQAPASVDLPIRPNPILAASLEPRWHCQRTRDLRETHRKDGLVDALPTHANLTFTMSIFR